MSSPVIVFGATGDVGAATARHAEHNGSRVVLAVRNLEKPIPGLTADAEKTGNFVRVQVDLGRPDTVEAAVRSTGAKRAFLMIAVQHGAPEDGRAAVEALKAGGVEFVVLLSSISVQGDDLAAIQPGDYIPWIHAQYEMYLHSTFGRDSFVSLRPGFFNSNIRWWSGGIAKGNIEVAFPDAQMEWIAPSDIGKTAAAFLSQLPEAVADKPEILLCGPEPLTIRQAMAATGRVLGRDIQVSKCSEQQSVQLSMSLGLPEEAARRLVRELIHHESPDDGWKQMFQEGSANCKKYTHTPTTVEDWVRENKHMFSNT